jgi:hypothetical protein
MIRRHWFYASRKFKIINRIGSFSKIIYKKNLPGTGNSVAGPGGSFGLENQLSLNASAFHQWPLCLNPRIIRDERSVCSSFDINQPDTLSCCVHLLKDKRHETLNSDG